MWAVDQWHEKLKMPHLCARRFFFQNEQFQAAFTDLNSVGYYRLSNKVGW